MDVSRKWSWHGSVLLGLLLMLLGDALRSVHAASEPVTLVLSGNTPPYREFQQALTQQLQRDIHTLALDQLGRQPVSALVAVGTRACEQALWHQSHERLLCSLIPSHSFKTLLHEYYTHHDRLPEQVQAVFMDQPLSRQLHLARLLSPQGRYIATLYGDTSQQHAEEFELQARLQGFSPNTAHLQARDNPVHLLRPLFERSDIYLALPDSALFNRAVTKWVLYISLRQGVPVIGYSAAYADAGALISLYSTPAQLGQQSADLLNQPMPAHTPDTHWPRAFTLRSNATSARNLRVELPDIPSLTQQLLEAETP